MNDSDDSTFKAALKQAWTVPDAPDTAKMRVLAAAANIHPAKTTRKTSRWLFSLSAMAATVVAAVLFGSTLQKPAPASPTASAQLTDEEMLNYVFATYSLEETL
jgi:hypothetical protein